MSLYNNVVDGITEYVVNNTKDKSEYDLEILRYGIEVIIMNVSKLIIIFAFMFIIGLIKECLIVTVLYGGIRGFGSGLHVKGFIKCLLFSILHFLFMIFTAYNVAFDMMIRVPVAIGLIILIAMYAPADTEEKPYLDREIRIGLKKKAIAVSVLYSMIWLIGFTGVYSGFFIAAIIGQVIMIHPLTYKIAKRRYNNYLYEDEYL